MQKWWTYGTQKKLFTLTKLVFFSVTAQSGARYIMVMVTIDRNTILVSTIKNKSDQELRRAYLELLDRAKATGLDVKKACFR